METTAAKPRVHTAIWIATLWSGFGLVDAIQTVLVMRAEGMHHAWAWLFVTSWISWLPWALATPLIMGLGRHFPPATPAAYQHWLVHLSVCAMIGLVFVAWTSGLDTLLNPYADSVAPSFLDHWLDHFCNGILTDLVLYAAVLAVSHVLDSRARLAQQQIETFRLNEQLLKAQLEALRRQIEPHFFLTRSMRLQRSCAKAASRLPSA